MLNNNEKIIVELFLTQKEIDALWLVSTRVNGPYYSMRNVFRSGDGNNIKNILRKYVSKQISENLYYYIKGFITFLK